MTDYWNLFGPAVRKIRLNEPSVVCTYEPAAESELASCFTNHVQRRYLHLLTEVLLDVKMSVLAAWGRLERGWRPEEEIGKTPRYIISCY
jgi:hypothetical protein